MKKYGFTLVELLVVIAVIALLMAILVPALNRAKEQGKRAVCLYKLEQLMIAWTIYADNNDDKIVRGDTGEYDSIHHDETPWVLRDWPWPGNPPMPKEQQKESIMKGALFRYTKDLSVYRCQTVQGDDKLRTYSVVDSMNGGDRTVLPGLGPYNAVMIKLRQQIRKPYERIVFFDDGGEGDGAMGGFSIFVYNNSDPARQSWWDVPPIRHGAGSTFSFADGHSEYHKWMDKKTIALGMGESPNKNQPGNEDLRWFSLGVWGSPPVDRMPN